jgi:hypothetical protein
MSHFTTPSASGNVDFAGARTEEEIDSIVRILFSSFGGIQSVSLSSRR